MIHAQASVSGSGNESLSLATGTAPTTRLGGFPPPQELNPLLNGYFGALEPHPPSSVIAPQHRATLAPTAMAYNHLGQLSAADLARSGVFKSDSLSPEPPDNDATQARSDTRPHRRGYQACQRCRERKVKCDLGSMCILPPCYRAHL